MLRGQPDLEMTWLDIHQGLVDLRTRRQLLHPCGLYRNVCRSPAVQRLLSSKPGPRLAAPADHGRTVGPPAARSRLTNSSTVPGHRSVAPSCRPTRGGSTCGAADDSTTTSQP